MNTTHLMLDIETGATRPGSVVYSAALVRFGDEAHTTVNLNREEQLQKGLFEEESTLQWWMKQGPEARTAAFVNPVQVEAALAHITEWIRWAVGGPFQIWCHGAGFDAPIMEFLYKTWEMECPWNFYQVRDTRTLYDLAGINRRDFDIPPPHIALNDAIAQTRAAVAAINRLVKVAA